MADSVGIEDVEEKIRPHSSPSLVLIALIVAVAAVLPLTRQIKRSILDDSNNNMLQQCDPWFAQRVRATFSDMTRQGYELEILYAWREGAEQRLLKQAGLSEVEFGFHNITCGTAPRSFAVDVREQSQLSAQLALALARAARMHQLRTGILWGLNSQERAYVNSLISVRESDKISISALGWDPYHIEPNLATVRDAIARLRETCIETDRSRSQ